MKSNIVLACITILVIMGCDNAQKTAETGYAETVHSGIKSASDYTELLEAYPNGVFASRNGEKIRTQIMSFQFVEGNKVFFCTGSEKPLYTQLIQLPYVSYCVYPEDFEPVLSLNGTVVFSDDAALKERAFNGTGYASEFIRRHYHSVDNPNLQLFYIDVEEIETYDYTGAHIYKTQ